MSDVTKISVVIDVVECPKGHAVSVVWLPDHRQFAFSCNICKQTSLQTSTPYGFIEVRIVTKVS